MTDLYPSHTYISWRTFRNVADLVLDQEQKFLRLRPQPLHVPAHLFVFSFLFFFLNNVVKEGGDVYECLCVYPVGAWSRG